MVSEDVHTDGLTQGITVFLKEIYGSYEAGREDVAKMLKYLYISKLDLWKRQ